MVGGSDSSNLFFRYVKDDQIKKVNTHSCFGLAGGSNPEDLDQNKHDSW